MASYDDYDGDYFTLHALRMFHGEALADAEILVIDNNPTGDCAEALKSLEGASADYRYVPMTERTGTMVRQRIVDEGRGDFVLVMKGRVLRFQARDNRIGNAGGIGAFAAGATIDLQDVHSVLHWVG